MFRFELTSTVMSASSSRQKPGLGKRNGTDGNVLEISLTEPWSIKETPKLSPETISFTDFTEPPQGAPLQIEIDSKISPKAQIGLALVGLVGINEKKNNHRE